MEQANMANLNSRNVDLPPQPSQDCSLDAQDIIRAVLETERFCRAALHWGDTSANPQHAPLESTVSHD
jgi:hypothetical protein